MLVIFSQYSVTELWKMEDDSSEIMSTILNKFRPMELHDIFGFNVIRSWNLLSNDFRNFVAVNNRIFWANVPKENEQWIYLVLNFIGPNIGQ